ncbi:hypothetical protein [Desulfatiferula olefinivorans]
MGCIAHRNGVVALGIGDGGQCVCGRADDGKGIPALTHHQEQGVHIQIADACRRVETGQFCAGKNAGIVVFIPRIIENEGIVAGSGVDIQAGGDGVEPGQTFFRVTRADNLALGRPDQVVPGPGFHRNGHVHGPDVNGVFAFGGVDDETPGGSVVVMGGDHVHRVVAGTGEDFHMFHVVMVQANRQIPGAQADDHEGPGHPGLIGRGMADRLTAPIEDRLVPVIVCEITLGMNRLGPARLIVGIGPGQHIDRITSAVEDVVSAGGDGVRRIQNHMTVLVKGQVAVGVHHGLTEYNSLVTEVVHRITGVVDRLVAGIIDHRITAAVDHGFPGQMDKGAAVAVHNSPARFVEHLLTAVVTDHFVLHVEGDIAFPVNQKIPGLVQQNGAQGIAFHKAGHRIDDGVTGHKHVAGVGIDLGRVAVGQGLTGRRIDLRLTAEEGDGTGAKNVNRIRCAVVDRLACGIPDIAFIFQHHPARAVDHELACGVKHRFTRMEDIRR